MASKNPKLRPMTIKAGVLKRCSKEKVMYEEEAVKQEAKIARLKEEGTDEYTIRKQEEVLAESRMMIPDCEKRINKAYVELKNLMDTLSDPEVLESKEYGEAQELLRANIQVPTGNV